MTGYTIVSRHFFRRRARDAARRCNATDPGKHTVVKAKRGPWRWFCVRLHNPEVSETGKHLEVLADALSTPSVRSRKP